MPVDQGRQDSGRHPHQILDVHRVVHRRGEGEEPADRRHAAELDFAEQAHGLQPAEDLLDLVGWIPGLSGTRLNSRFDYSAETLQEDRRTLATPLPTPSARFSSLTRVP